LAGRLPAYAGRLMQAELEALEAALDKPERPVAALIGGAKVSSKLAVLGHLIDKVDALIIGGGMANTFLHAQGVEVGKSLCEKDLAGEAKAILEQAQARGCKVVLPVDGVTATEFKPGAAHALHRIDAIPQDAMILDIGPESVEDVTVALEAYRTLLWNGPMGAFEVPPFDAGTNAVARVAAALTEQRGPMPASSTSSPTSRPPAGRSWNGWKARSCRAWPPWRGPERDPRRRPRSRPAAGAGGPGGRTRRRLAATQCPRRGRLCRRRLSRRIGAGRRRGPDRRLRRRCGAGHGRAARRPA
jgi:phosphoglycerate kinase